MSKKLRRADNAFLEKWSGGYCVKYDDVFDGDWRVQIFDNFAEALDYFKAVAKSKKEARDG